MSVNHVRGVATLLLGASLALFTSDVARAQAPAPEMHPPRHEMDWARTTFVLAEVLEYLPGPATRRLQLDATAWTGGPVHRLWLSADGSAATRGSGSAGSFEALYGRAISPFWDAQIGARVDLVSGSAVRETRAGAALALKGLAPGWFELEPTLFVSTDGDLSADLTASYDLYVTQRLVLQPRLEAMVAAQDIPTFGVGRGLSEGSLAFRLRYEFRREFAPYVGVAFERAFGRTADLARAAGEESGESQLVLGLRLWR